MTVPNDAELFAKIRALPAEKFAQVEDFVDFLRTRGRDRDLTSTFAGRSEDAFAALWDNPEDAEYEGCGALEAVDSQTAACDDREAPGSA